MVQETTMTRRDDVDRFYELLAILEERVGGKQRLGECTGYMNWPDRGVYFFFAPDEYHGEHLRLTRVGTHAVSRGSQTSLWNRLRTHRGAQRGTYEGGGNHRGSVFRKRVGEAIIERDDLHEEYPEWGQGSSAGREQRLNELELERRVSDYLRDLPFLFVNIDDEPGPESQRAYIERNAIALLSNYDREAIDLRKDWLGEFSQSEKIRESELWNVNHIDEEYDPEFLEVLRDQIDKTSPV